MWFKASAPGSLMLLGEYAVLENKHALVCAVDRRMTVTLTPREDNSITIKSALGEFTTSLANIEIVSPFQFVLTALRHFHKKMPSGCDIQIEAEFSDQIGFASSAAVTVSLVSALAAWLTLSFSPLELLKVCRKIVREVQGIGSGADVAACIFGGIVFYRPQPLLVEKLPGTYPLVAMYSGSKTPTAVAIKQVQQTFAENLPIFQSLCQAINTCVLEARQAISEKQWLELGNIMNIQQGLMEALGVNTPELQEIIYTLRRQPDMFGAKISGSGLGDCAIGLGTLSPDFLQDPRHIPIKITDQGVLCEKN